MPRKSNKKVFFSSQRTNSRQKSFIVSDYFWAWSKIIVDKLRSNQYLQFIDLFAGAGRYEDDNASTPLMILDKVIKDLKLSRSVKLIFNEADPVIYRRLKHEIETYPNVDLLSYPPQILNESVGGSQLEQMLLSYALMPTLLFADPWGYKGLTMSLFSSVVKRWGCEVIFFFNYSRINAAMTHNGVKRHINGLFGERRAERIRQALVNYGEPDEPTWFEKASPEEREAIILSQVTSAFNEALAPELVYTQKFRFMNAKGSRTSHYLIFATKSSLALGVMKDIMARQSTSKEQGVASFESNPKDAQLSFFELPRESPLDKLIELLQKDFAEQRLSVRSVWENHHTRTQNYTSSNYKQALLVMEERELIRVVPPRDARRTQVGKPTMSDENIIIFAKLIGR